VTDTFPCHVEGCKTNALLRYRVTPHQRRSLFDAAARDMYSCGNTDHQKQIKQTGTVLSVATISDLPYARKVEE
jgi:hypothetical protein